MSQFFSFPGLQWLLRTGGFRTIQTPRFLRRRCLLEVGRLMWLTACIEIGLTHELHATKTEAHEKGSEADYNSTATQSETNSCKIGRHVRQRLGTKKPRC